jgi:hypothetical protein
VKIVLTILGVPVALFIAFIVFVNLTAAPVGTDKYYEQTCKLSANDLSLKPGLLEECNRRGLREWAK